MKPWIVHSFYLLLIAVLAGIIVRKHLLDGEAVLSASLATTSPVAQAKIRATNHLFLNEIKVNVEIYTNTRSLAHGKSAQKFNDLGERLIYQLNIAPVNPTFLNDSIQQFLDTLQNAIHPESKEFQILQQNLLQNTSQGWITRLNRMRSKQTDLINLTLPINLLIGINRKLNYDLENVSGCWFLDDYLPFQLSNILCPVAGQTFTTTVFLTSWPPKNNLHPEFDKVWANGQPAAISEGMARFSTVFEKPGQLPLHIRIEKRVFLPDSVRVFEKTYTVNVQ